jgi:hypothetical protein
MNAMKIRTFACDARPLALACGLAVALGGLGLAMGCSSSSTPSGAGTDASVDAVGDAVGDAPADPPQDAGTDTGSTACNALSNVGAVVQQMYVATDPEGAALARRAFFLEAAREPQRAHAEHRGEPELGRTSVMVRRRRARL